MKGKVVGRAEPERLGERQKNLPDPRCHRSKMFACENGDF